MILIILFRNLKRYLVWVHSRYCFQSILIMEENCVILIRHRGGITAGLMEKI